MNSRIREDVQKLFEFWCELSPINTNDPHKFGGQITASFPENYNDAEIIKRIPEFAYPCKISNDSVQTYSFVLTNTDSKFGFGFCRHDPKTSTAMVILTYLPWHDTFIKFLNVLGELKKSDNGEFQPFLVEAYLKGVPEPGASLKLFYNAGVNNFMFQRPSQFQLPSIPENNNLNLYYNFVDPKNMIHIFAAMLSERRIIFKSRHLDRLSSCIQAANAFLYPMVWQHIFIPILPMHLKDFLCAPMPFLIGVPEAVLETMTKDELGEVVILNCDNRTLETPFDDTRDMPPELVNQLKKQLNNQHEHIGDRVSKIFLGILVQLIGGYRDAIKFTQGQKITWDENIFIDSRAPHLRPYLRHMIELQIFRQFIDERLEMLNTGLGFSDEFELETLRHSEKSNRKGKQYKEFLRNVKDKTNPAVKSAVQSVKQGSRGVKTAYKDLKSKLRDKTPPNSSTSHHYGGHMSYSYDSRRTEVGSSHPHSAPNSPVFTKRPQTSIDHQSYNNYHRNSNNSMLQTSNSALMMNNSNYQNNNNNNHINKSPTVSQPSSNSSSEMNILQELQQHVLFKTPVVDRSLKPTNSLDSTIRHVRSGSVLNTPNNKFECPEETLCIFDDDIPTTVRQFEQQHFKDYQKKLHSQPPPPSDESLNSSSKSSISFDSPPEMPSPPVPPRITTATTNKPKSHSNTNHLLNNRFDSELVPPPLPPSSSSVSLSFENNFVNNDLISIIDHQLPQSKEPELFVSVTPIAPIRKHLINNSKVSEPSTPVKSSTATTDDATPNLICLDTNTSFELEDFDPLNKNAKPLPEMLSLNKHLTTNNVASSMTHLNSSSVTLNSAFNNPVYPYFTPQKVAQKPAQPNLSKAFDSDDVELLRKYGLDKLSFGDGSSASGSNSNVNASGSNASNSTRTSSDRNNWTQFY